MELCDTVQALPELVWRQQYWSYGETISFNLFKLNCFKLIENNCRKIISFQLYWLIIDWI